jgi:hypothetical protein
MYTVSDVCRCESEMILGGSFFGLSSWTLKFICFITSQYALTRHDHISMQHSVKRVLVSAQRCVSYASEWKKEYQKEFLRRIRALLVQE